MLVNRCYRLHVTDVGDIEDRNCLESVVVHGHLYAGHSRWRFAAFKVTKVIAAMTHAYSEANLNTAFDSRLQSLQSHVHGRLLLMCDEISYCRWLFTSTLHDKKTAKWNLNTHTSDDSTRDLASPETGASQLLIIRFETTNSLYVLSVMVCAIGHLVWKYNTTKEQHVGLTPLPQCARNR